MTRLISGRKRTGDVKRLVRNIPPLLFLTLLQWLCSRVLRLVFVSESATILANGTISFSRSTVSPKFAIIPTKWRSTPNWKLIYSLTQFFYFTNYIFLEWKIGSLVDWKNLICCRSDSRIMSALYDAFSIVRSLTTAKMDCTDVGSLCRLSGTFIVSTWRFIMRNNCEGFRSVLPFFSSHTVLPFPPVLTGSPFLAVGSLVETLDEELAFLNY